MSDSSETLRERVGWSSVRMWVLLRLNRWVLTAVILVVVYVILVAVSRIGLSPLRATVATQYSHEYLFSAFIGAIITGTSIVVTINQLVLSQELGAVGNQRTRMNEALEFRRDVESHVDPAVSPPEPSAFIYELVDGIEESANRLRTAVETDRDEDLRNAVDEYVDELTRNAREVKDRLEGAQFGTFEVIWNALDFNYSRKIYDGRQLRAERGDALSEEADDALEETIERLQFFSPTREHFKTLYFQWELINLSRALLYIAVPALLVMAALIMYLDASAFPGTTLGTDNLVWVMSAGFVVGISPFVVFIVFILRIATVAKRTLAMGPFILRESEREEDIG